MDGLYLKRSVEALGKQIPRAPAHGINRRLSRGCGEAARLQRGQELAVHVLPLSYRSLSGTCA